LIWLEEAARRVVGEQFVGGLPGVHNMIVVSASVGRSVPNAAAIEPGEIWFV
jgi:hypothetical protein